MSKIETRTGEAAIPAATGFTIADTAARTGLSEATLRAWEERHGFPRPVRQPNGHRRYTSEQLEQIGRVVAAREHGRTLEAAIAEVTSAGLRPADADRSIFSGLVRRRPELGVSTLSRRAMLAVSHAIEDECSAQADRAWFYLAFQHASAYRAARTRRWGELSHTAAATVVLADFPRSAVRADRVYEVAIPPGHPQRREWSVVCDAPHACAVLAGWERPDGRFEATWSVDAEDVATAVDLARSLAARHAPSLPLPDAAGVRADHGATSLRATRLAARIVEYLDRG